MQQYMVQIIKNLKEKGYRQLNPESNNVYGRADSDAVYIVVIGSNHNLDSETLKSSIIKYCLMFLRIRI